jgi:putative SbcD/Mre11-related phosphoesterase
MKERIYIKLFFPEVMEILRGIEMIGKALWVKSKKVLIIADLHIGYEEALNKQGVLVPRTQFKETEKELKELLKKVKPKVIVINGDLKHEFGEISEQEWEETLKILDLLSKYSEKIILIKGNHDNILGPIAKKRNLDVVKYYCVNGICMVHGDKILKDKKVISSKILIIGHEHPAIALREGVKVERYKCYLLGKFKKQKLVVMPSFIPMLEGTDIKKESLLSPHLKYKIHHFEVFILGDKIYHFGKLKNLK